MNEWGSGGEKQLFLANQLYVTKRRSISSYFCAKPCWKELQDSCMNQIKMM